MAIPARTEPAVDTGPSSQRGLSGRPAERTARRPRLRPRRHLPLWLLMLPGLAYFLVFQYGAIFGLVIAFKDYEPFLGVTASPWVGLANFRVLLADPSFWHAALNTVELALLQLIFFFPVPLGIALLLHGLTSDLMRRVTQSVVYVPHFISWVIVVAMAQQVLGGAGVLNGVLSDHGVHTVNVLADPDLFKPLMVAEVIWKDSGWAAIIFMAALTQIDEQLYEAAAIDGASAWRRFVHVTLPGLRPVIILLLILRLGDILSVGFEQILLQRDAVGPAAGEVIDTFVYYRGIASGNFGVATAAGLFKGVIGALLVWSANRVAHRLGEQGVYQ